LDLATAIAELEHRPAAYVLESADRSYRYKGPCRDLPVRMQDHHEGRVSRTKNRRPLKLIYFEYFGEYGMARQREMYLKSGAGREWLQRRIGKVLSAYGPRGGPAADPP
jgi:putative endonuclease